MATKSIVIHVDEEEVTLLLKSASKADGIRRANLMASHREGEMAGRSEIEKQVAFYLYPTCVAAVKDPPEWRDAGFDKFLTVDEEDMDAWVKAAYELNPQWQRAWKMMAEMSETDEKKVGTPSDGSTEATGQPEQATSQPSKS